MIKRGNLDDRESEIAVTPSAVVSIVPVAMARTKAAEYERRLRANHPNPDETTELALAMGSAVLKPSTMAHARRVIAKFRAKYPKALTKAAEKRLWEASELRVRSAQRWQT